SHLIEQDQENVAIIMGSRDEFLESEKLNGYCQALQKHDIPVREELIIETDGSRQGGYDGFFTAVEAQKIPEAFFTTSDLLAVGLSEAIKMGGYFIPDDFSIVCYGESLITSIINPPLSVVAEPLGQLGKYAAKFLIQLIEGKSPPEMIKVLEPRLQMRESSTPHLT
ncbi:MAG: LacI family DNA-binding transcriptional regulator, partial [Halanaerobiaceae bacterium]